MSGIFEDRNICESRTRTKYAYDNAANRTAEQLDNAVTGATYNNRNQVTSRQPGGALLFRGTLNKPARVTVQGQPAQVAADNSFVAQVPVGAGTTNVVVAATDYSGNTRTNTYQITQSGTTTSYTYDPNGNLTGDGTRTFDWDAENRLLDVKQGTTTLASFVYDGLGRRAQKIAGGVTHTYVYDEANIIEERLSSGQTYDYVQGPGVDRPLAMRDQASVVSYYLADHLGSIVQTTNASGAVTLTREYDPWGNALQGSTSPGYAFTGREWDPETNLYYYRARYYDSKMGRFLSEDPIGFESGSNFFAYVQNNPATLTDPVGLQPAGSLYCEGLKKPCPKDCNMQRIRNTVTRVRSLSNRACSGILPRGQAAGGISLFGPWYLPSGDPCVDYCICVHENRHVQQATSGALKVTPTWQLECQGYWEQLKCLRQLGAGAVL